ncbi:MAG: tetratricopeptide repeat protein, partial [Eubacteriales bacterium]|nr:tetratricopeptide repeat protein [Eubacteriales bacterium]
DNLLSARAAFWKAEAFYRTGDYQGSAALYRRFLSMAGASRTEEYSQAFYNLGYALFKTQQYSGALDQYSRYVALEKDHAQQKISDAWNRMGDCRFMLQSYAEAAKSYERAVSMGQADSDYAMFQQAFCYGLMQQQDRKIETLGRLIASFPESSRISAALFETGRAHVVSGRPQPASQQFQELIRRFPSGSYTGKAYLELALIAYNGGNNDEAIGYYKQVVSSFPDSDDARSALLGLRNVYSDLNEGETFLQYAASLGGSLGNISASEQETISFRSAQNLYIQKEYEKAVPGLVRYLDRFPDGSFAANARYFLADCYERSGRQEESLVLYEQVASSRNSFTEDALSAAAVLRFQREEWDLALDLYRRLLAVAEISDHVTEARIGEMRCAYRLGQYEQSLSSSVTLLRHDKSSPEIIRESGFTQARSLLGLQRQEEALDAFRKVAEDIKSQEGAESKFRVIEILYGQRKLDEAESEVFDFVSKNPGHTYWLAKAFLLLSDIYIIRHDVFQASQTLQSLIDNYENQEDGIIHSAKEKKAALENLQ